MKGITFTTPRLSVAMSLIFGLATIAAAPTVEAVTIDQVDICDGLIDVNESGCPANDADDLSDFALWCNDAAPVQVDIVNGGVDVTENGTISDFDDLFNCDLNDENSIGGVLVPSTNQVDIIDGGVDVTEVGGVTAFDDATDVKLFNLP